MHPSARQRLHNHLEGPSAVAISMYNSGAGRDCLYVSPSLTRSLVDRPYVPTQLRAENPGPKDKQRPPHLGEQAYTYTPAEAHYLQTGLDGPQLSPAKEPVDTRQLFWAQLLHNERVHRLLKGAVTAAAKQRAREAEVAGPPPALHCMLPAGWPSAAETDPFSQLNYKKRKAVEREQFEAGGQSPE
ncbi:hypothetical protein DIPPA_34040 [Diplonema papillatum]|nr:hypothetical protein DIPPA_34040 [Diplonema papillatum]